MNRVIKKVAVLGSGVMGSRIACHFANIGVQVLLLDIVPKELSDDEKKKGLTMEHPFVRNRIVNTALQTAIFSKPAPLFDSRKASLVKTGNFDDDMKSIAECDWVMEVVVENLDIKKKVYDQVEKFRDRKSVV
ncbi:MAG: 3-hydroxyacyl-CoA dehydrogenase NAD-binding domain-containing protein, partial [Imperialibacter sp.]